MNQQITTIDKINERIARAGDRSKGGLGSDELLPAETLGPTSEDGELGQELDLGKRGTSLGGGRMSD